MSCKIIGYSIRVSTHKIPMNCSKFYMMHDMTLLLSTGRSEFQQYSCRTVGIVGTSVHILELLHGLFVVVFTLVG